MVNRVQMYYSTWASHLLLTKPYFILDFAVQYASKGDLMDMLGIIGCFDQKTTRFYTAEVSSCSFSFPMRIF